MKAGERSAEVTAVDTHPCDPSRLGRRSARRPTCTQTAQNTENFADSRLPCLLSRLSKSQHKKSFRGGVQGHVSDTLSAATCTFHLPRRSLRGTQGSRGPPRWAALLSDKQISPLAAGEF